jgi:hypothetical protein
VQTVKTQLEKFSPDVLILEPANGFEMFTVVHGR